MATIHIDYAASKEAVARVRAHLDDVALRDVNWSGADFEIERDDYTWIEGGDSYKSAALLNDVQRILRADSPEDAAQQLASDIEMLQAYTLNDDGAELLAGWVKSVAKNPADQNMDTWVAEAENAANNASQKESIVIEMRGFMTASGRPETLTIPRTAFDLVAGE